MSRDGDLVQPPSTKITNHGNILPPKETPLDIPRRYSWGPSYTRCTTVSRGRWANRIYLLNQGYWTLAKPSTSQPHRRFTPPETGSSERGDEAEDELLVFSLNAVLRALMLKSSDSLWHPGGSIVLPPAEKIGLATQENQSGIPKTPGRPVLFSRGSFLPRAWERLAGKKEKRRKVGLLSIRLGRCEFLPPDRGSSRARHPTVRSFLFLVPADVARFSVSADRSSKPARGVAF